MLRLGHIDYSNCVPVHARILDERPAEIELHFGVPSALNAALAQGRIDVAPCSSIEYARHAEQYRLIPDVTIGAAAAVESIVLLSDRPPAALQGADIAVPTASATSVVLLRILLELRWQVQARFHWFDQSAAPPDVDAVLWIGDVALQRRNAGAAHTTDLGMAWREWTGLPFAFALWQTPLPTERDAELAALHGLLLNSLVHFERNAAAYANRYAVRFGLTAERLARYWAGLQFRIDPSLEQGLHLFYRYAAELGEISTAPSLRWSPRGEAQRSTASGSPS